MQRLVKKTVSMDYSQAWNRAFRCLINVTGINSVSGRRESLDDQRIIGPVRLEWSSSPLPRIGRQKFNFTWLARLKISDPGASGLHKAWKLSKLGGKVRFRDFRRVLGIISGATVAQGHQLYYRDFPSLLGDRVSLPCFLSFPSHQCVEFKNTVYELSNRYYFMENLSRTILAELKSSSVLRLNRDTYRGIPLNFERVLGFEGMETNGE